MVASGARGGAVAPPRARERARGGGTHTRTHAHTHTRRHEGMDTQRDAGAHTHRRALVPAWAAPNPPTANRTPFLTDSTDRRGGASLCTGGDTRGGDAARSPRTAMAAKGTRRRDPFVRCGCVCVCVCVCVCGTVTVQREAVSAHRWGVQLRARRRAAPAPAPRRHRARQRSCAEPSSPPFPRLGAPGWASPRAHATLRAAARPPAAPRARRSSVRAEDLHPPTHTPTHTQHPHTHKQEDRARCDDDDTEGAPRRPRTASRPWRRWSRAARRRAARR